MKRVLKVACTLFLLLGLCAPRLSAAADSAADPEALQITALSITKADQSAVLRMTLHNTGVEGIDEFSVALAFYDQNGDRFFAYDTTQEGYTQEVCNWYYTLEEAIAVLADYKTKDVFTGYGEAVTVMAAIRYYHLESGPYVILPESEWVWVLPGDGLNSAGTNRTYYTQPSEDVYTLLNDVYLGYKYYLLDDYSAAYYGMNQGGEWITAVEVGSLADEAGLAVGDLVLFADGVRPTENVYAVEYALAEVARGNAIEWVYERDGLIRTAKISGI
jgi:hypothetical protein